MKILVVDDFRSMREIVKSLLMRLGYHNLVEADNGLSAIKILSENPDVQLIVSDWNMPKMTGLELLKAIRRSKGFAHKPFLLLTAEAEKENIIEAAKYQVDDYLIKPVNGNMLKEKIEKVIQRRLAAAKIKK